MENKENKPVKKFRSGQVTATIWENLIKDKDGKEKFIQSATLEKSYTDKDGNWKTTSNLGASDLNKALLVLQKANEFCNVKEE